MRKFAFIITTILLSLGICIYFFAVNHAAESTSISERLAAVKDYKYYLDKGNESIGKEMAKVDLVIVEPIEMQQRYIDQAQRNGTLVYGYINAMEADKWNSELYNQLLEEDFYRDDHGEKMYFSEWDSYLVDMTSEHYQELLLKEIKTQIVQKELDGVFLDTVGNINSFLPEKEQQVQNEAMLSFIKKIKQQYDGLSVAQNWGFQTLADYTAPYVEFIMWEDFTYEVVGKDEWSLDTMKQLVQIREKFGTQVMTIGFSDEKKSRALAEKYDFKFFFSPAGSYYNTWQ